MSIQSGLIIYHSKRYQSYPHICSKYRIVPGQLDYNLCNLKYRKDRRMKIPRFHHISKVSHSVNLSYKIAKGISQLSAQPSYLRRLRLVLCWPRNEEEFSLLTNKVLRKFISKAKRVTKIDVEIESEKGFKASTLKHLRFLQSSKNIRIRLLSSREITFQALHELLFSSKSNKRFPHFENAYLQFELRPDHVMDQAYVSDYLSNFSAAIVQYKQSPRIDLTEFKVRLPFFVTPDPILTNKFVRSIENFPSLMYLGHAFEPATPKDLSSDIVQIVQNLKVLDFCLVGSHTDLLPQIIQKALDMKSLQKLVIWLRRLHIEPVKVFFKELKGLKQINWLILNFENGVGLDDKALGILGQSLGQLKNLKILELNFNKTNQPVTISANGIDPVLKSLGKLTQLEELGLFFNNFGEAFLHKLYQTLCNSLKNLKELRSLILFVQGNRVRETDLALFEKYLKRSSNLESLILNFLGIDPIKSEVLEKFVRSFDSQKTLKILSLKLRGTELNDSLVSTIYSTVYNLKNLDNFVLNLLSDTDQNPFIPQRAYNQLLQLENRKTVVIERI